MSIDRRDFLKSATAGAGLTLAGGSPLSALDTHAAPRAPLVRRGQAPDITVIGAGSFGAWTSLYLQRMGARVRLVDQYGPGNSRSTSGGETRGVRSSYGDRPQGLQWGRWAAESIRRWKAWDEEYGSSLLPRLFFTTGDVIMRQEMEPFLEQTVANWDAMGHAYEILDADEVRYRWPVIEPAETTVALYEPDAGVVRARRAIESVATVFEHEGGAISIGRASMGQTEGRTLSDVVLDDGDRITGEVFVFALGPWFPKAFPEVMGGRIRATTLGHVLYMATPAGSHAYEFPNLPSYNVPGCTGWPALPPDFRGFRVRASGASDENQDPDTSIRTVPESSYERPREVLKTYFPALAEMPISETRACHYEGSVSRNFIIDKHPDYDNVWLVGGGNAEAFKQGPVMGDYIAGRVMGTETDPQLIEDFKFPEEEFDPEEERRRAEERRRRNPGG